MNMYNNITKYVNYKRNIYLHACRSMFDNVLNISCIYQLELILFSPSLQ